MYNIWCKPKCFNNGQSAAKPRIEEGSTTIPYGSRIASDWQSEMVDYLLNVKNIFNKIE